MAKRQRSGKTPRRVRKRERKLKRLAPKPHETRKETTHFKELCWRLARAMTHGKPSGDHDAHFCPTCRETYCLGFDNTTVYCKDCWYKTCCIREIKNPKPCFHCGR